MKFNTRKFGEIEVDEKKILIMPEGLPGFPGHKKFALLEDPKTAPFCWYQSMEDANLALVVMSPFIFKPDYEIDLEDFTASRKNWKGVKPKDLLVYVVINVSEEKGEKSITANLVGPIVMNSKNNEAVQVVLANSSYSHQHNVLGG